MSEIRIQPWPSDAVYKSLESMTDEEKGTLDSFMVWFWDMEKEFMSVAMSELHFCNSTPLLSDYLYKYGLRSMLEFDIEGAVSRLETMPVIPTVWPDASLRKDVEARLPALIDGKSEAFASESIGQVRDDLRRQALAILSLIDTIEPVPEYHAFKE